MKVNKKKGLTLIELLVAMCIFSIIIMISSRILDSFTNLDKKTTNLKVSTEKLREYISYVKDDARISEGNSNINYVDTKVKQIDFCLREGPEDNEVRYVRYVFNNNKLEVYRTQSGDSYTKLNDSQRQKSPLYSLDDIDGNFQVISRALNSVGESKKKTLKIYVEQKDSKGVKLNSLVETVVIGENL